MAQTTYNQRELQGTNPPNAKRAPRGYRPSLSLNNHLVRLATSWGETWHWGDRYPLAMFPTVSYVDLQVDKPPGQVPGWVLFQREPISLEPHPSFSAWKDHLVWMLVCCKGRGAVFSGTIHIVKKKRIPKESMWYLVCYTYLYICI